MSQPANQQPRPPDWSKRIANLDPKQKQRNPRSVGSGVGLGAGILVYSIYVQQWGDEASLGIIE